MCIRDSFYGWWDSRYVPLLLASITCNYWCAFQIGEKSSQASKKRWLVSAIAANLLLLGYYKYANFFISSVGALSSTSFQSLDIILPIGISFFTFTQIAFLAVSYTHLDVYKRQQRTHVLVTMHEWPKRHGEKSFTVSTFYIHAIFCRQKSG